MIISLLVNLWIVFLLEITSEINSEITFCDIKHEFDQIYLYFTLAYIGIKMLLPILVIFISNFLIILNISKLNEHKQIIMLRENRTTIRSARRRELIQQLSQPMSTIRQNDKLTGRVKPFYLSMNQVINRETHNAQSSRMLTKMIVLISFTYACLNLPYFILWLIYYYDEMLKKENNNNNYLGTALKIAELFYLLNFVLNFYIYAASGTLFRSQLKYSGRTLIFFNINLFLFIFFF